MMTHPVCSHIGRGHSASDPNCADHTPPETTSAPQVSDVVLMLDTTVNMADLTRGDLSRLQLPATTSIWAHVDLVRAQRHLREASVLLDKVADQLEAAEVLR